jgi:hypothetical protein
VELQLEVKWGLFAIRTNELDITVEARFINKVVHDFNTNIIKAAIEIIPRGVRKNYIPYWTQTLQDNHDKMITAREEAETTYGQENQSNVQKSKAQYLKTKLECIHKSWRKRKRKNSTWRETPPSCGH